MRWKDRTEPEVTAKLVSIFISKVKRNETFLLIMWISADISIHTPPPPSCKEVVLHII